MKKISLELQERFSIMLFMLVDAKGLSTPKVIERAIDMYWKANLKEIRCKEPAKYDWLTKQYQAYLTETQAETQCHNIKSAISYFEEGSN